MEVRFFVLLRGQEDHDREAAFALVSLFSNPDPSLLHLSINTLWSCEYRGDSALRFIEVQSIQAVVAMVPHAPVIEGQETREQFFLVEKPGLDVTVMTGVGDDDESMDVGEHPDAVEMQGVV